ncbi:hypothetical protein JXM67_14315 [candidate division WOR-3 bacterium]|nr:hypothetical protein [candidate division WOR-3 bacterium]
MASAILTRAWERFIMSSGVATPGAERFLPSFLLSRWIFPTHGVGGLKE